MINNHLYIKLSALFFAMTRSLRFKIFSSQAGFAAPAVVAPCFVLSCLTLALLFL